VLEIREWVLIYVLRGWESWVVWVEFRQGFFRLLLVESL
jgi:tryptophan-rich sensory protein